MILAADVMTTDFTRFTSDDTVAKFCGSLQKTRDAFALVFDRKKYLGVVDKNALLRSHINPAKIKLKHCIKQVHILTPETPLREIVRFLMSGDVRVLPVKQGETISGVVKAHAVLPHLKKFYATITAQEIATKKIITCKNTDLIGKAINTMVRNHFDHIPIIDKQGVLIGVVSLVDLLLKYYVLSASKGVHISRAASHNQWRVTGFGTGEKQDLLKCPITNELSPTPQTCTPTTCVTTILEQMCTYSISSVFLVENDKPCGVITLKDVYKLYLESR